MTQRAVRDLEVGAVLASNFTYACGGRQEPERKRAVLHDHPSWCDHVSHSNKLLQIQLTEAHISDMAAAPSDPAGSWLMLGIASESAVSPQPQPLRTGGC